MNHVPKFDGFHIYEPPYGVFLYAIGPMSYMRNKRTIFERIDLERNQAYPLKWSMRSSGIAFCCVTPFPAAAC